MAVGNELEVWRETGIEMRIRDPDEDHSDYVITLPAFDVEVSGATLDDAIGAAFMQLDGFINMRVQERPPFPQPHHQADTGTGTTNGIDEE